MSLWVKLYSRDSEGVMRALPGIKMTKTGSLWIAKTVYDFPSRSGVGIRGPSETWEIAELRSESR